MVCDYLKSVMLYKISKVHFHLLGMTGFHVKTGNKRFTAADSCCPQNLKYKLFTSSFGGLHQKIAPESVTHMQHDYFSSFNQSNHWFVALPLLLLFLKFPNNIPLLPWETHYTVYWVWIAGYMIFEGCTSSQSYFHDQEWNLAFMVESTKK